ncbi:hypothetical protein [Enterovibrio sp. 27052020O]|uniref:hypothetical protein n=1 Tax=Enterovibrio sp. 27052020O TaxID=3241166 RepID=UPI00388EC488
MKINNIKKAALIAASLILVSGCSYRPPLVEANIPLIASQTQIQTEDVCLQSLPDSLAVGDAINLSCPDQTDYIVAETYTSGLGYFCAILIADHKDVTLCGIPEQNEAKHWFKIQPVMSGM